jgi:hypothetical protein
MERSRNIAAEYSGCSSGRRLSDTSEQGEVVAFPFYYGTRHKDCHSDTSNFVRKRLPYDYPSTTSPTHQDLAGAVVRVLVDFTRYSTLPSHSTAYSMLPFHSAPSTPSTPSTNSVNFAPIL